MKTPITHIGLAACLALALVAGSGPLVAKEKRERNNAITQSDSFLAGHPDLRWRTEGVESYGKGRYEEAMKRFKRAARFADKPSQAMVAEMYWRGEGVPMDRALGYVWIELAAERGTRDFLVKREYFWKNMSREEQQRALADGLAVFDEYGDAVAKPRIIETLRRARAQTTGSRTGHVGALTVMISNGAGGFMTVDGSQFYASKYWEPKEYFDWQEKVWEDLPRGQVDVGELQAADQAASTAGEQK